MKDFSLIIRVLKKIMQAFLTISTTESGVVSNFLVVFVLVVFITEETGPCARSIIIRIHSEPLVNIKCIVFLIRFLVRFFIVVII